MPHHQQSVQINNLDTETGIALAYETMKKLGWDILMATDNWLLGATPKSWTKKTQQVSCTIELGLLTVKSEMIHGEIIDVAGNNKKNTNSFTNTFERLSVTDSAGAMERNQEALTALRENTREAGKQKIADQEEMDKALNLTGSNLYVTYTIMALNLIVFILMVMDDAGVITPNGFVHIKWGSNFTPLTLSGDWWRLFTCTFIHFGVIHLIMNMYCLYTVGVYLEPMLGKLRYTSAYVCTGIIASVISLWWHTDSVNSAGASGAVFGMYGIFLALLTSSLIPKAARQELLKSIGIFVAYNLLYGMKGGVDNAAHIGGLVSGFVIGSLYVYGIKHERQEEQQIKWIIPAALVLTAVISVGYVQQHPVSMEERTNALNDVREYTFKDNQKFNEDLNKFDLTHRRINETISDTSLTNEQLIEKIDGFCFPEWNKAAQMIESTSKYDISPISHARAAKLVQYINLRKDELALQKQMAETGTTDELMPLFNEIRTKANAVFEEVVKQ